MFKITFDQFYSDDNDIIGYCRSCGAHRECCEPDARNYDCPSCGMMQVFGVSELLQMGLIEFI